MYFGSGAFCLADLRRSCCPLDYKQEAKLGLGFLWPRGGRRAKCTYPAPVCLGAYGLRV